MKLTYWSFLIFIILKQFYIFESGGVQPGDLFFLLSLFLFLFTKRNKEIKIDNVDRLLFYFIISIILINGFYAAYHQRIDFVLSTLHYIFNFLVVILFRQYAKDMSFLVMLFKACKLNLWIQLFVFSLGWGEYYAGVRYMGTFNDPNQMSFFLYITLMIMYLISEIINKKISLIYYSIVTFLIFQTASTGMFIALFIFIFLLIIFKLRFSILKKINAKKILIFNIALIVLILFVSTTPINIKKFSEDNFLFQRVEEKMSKIGNGNYATNYNQTNLIEERGIDKLFVYPERLILGAGQGYYTRFNLAAHTGEIHSTIPSVLFSYGILPTVLLLLWFIKNVRKVSFVTVLVFTPLLVESFTLLNQRQPFFWMLFILAFIYSKCNDTQQSVYLSDTIHK
ncbi:hypothetical protein M3182_14655 [Mesobacillus maritimus]|uniref:hypothetical protein n=1 Tax=Mesobacillus maritimus TaxID=1643336 RepID=UPI0020402D98|nr:hypothetical protein [Mesobacillus maritimus]MCM3586977.1 hypothetical protein [Mesobacillus maritimus]